MKRKLIVCCSLFMSLATVAQQARTVAIIPQPVSVTQKEGVFTLPQEITIAADRNLQNVTSYLEKKLEQSTGIGVNVLPGMAAATIRLELNKTAQANLGKEGYQLSVNNDGVRIAANAPAGLFYGVQSFLQLLPPAIESDTAVHDVKWEAPAVEITDYPRFGWRGLMLDVARHFFSKADVKKYIDDMARYKYNLLHFHLTDDEGWRIEIKSYPKLTEVGAWNVRKVGYFGTFPKPKDDEKRDYGGFYTQEDIKELVQYAKAQFIDIMPEIDVPGHSLATLAAYPELSCKPGAEKLVVRSGEEIMDWSRGAPPIALVDNTLCPANEKVYVFLDKVIGEVAQLFPFEYLHMGGDEAPHNYWEKSDVIKALMKKHNLKNMEQVQGYFTKRVEKIVNSKGRKFIGWDEILHGGITPSTAIMSWTGMEAGTKAAKAGHEVVMTPTTFAYIDYMQADQVVEPRVYASLRLNKSYQFEPLPEGVDPKYIKGGQANLWTEQIYNIRTAQYMTWPRGFAIAEALWTPKSQKDWNRFVQRTEAQFPRLDHAETKYARAMYDPSFEVKKEANGNFTITLKKEIEDLDLYYTIDNSFPDRYSEKYSGPITVPSEAAMLRVISYRGNQPMGRINTMTIEEMKRRTGNK